MSEKSDFHQDQPLALSAKRCPQCSKIARLQESECADCGHQFRTKFQDPMNRTQAFDAVLLPRAPHSSVRPVPSPVRAYPPPILTFGMAFLGSFSLVALLGVGAWLTLGLEQTAPPLAAVKPAALTSAATGLRTGNAQDLYSQITLSMSLYDVDQAAGGLGRVIRTSDPHTLLLSYDYQEQSVRVSLYRIDPASDDYRVQAVALYHGRQLLHRTSGDQ